MRWLVTAVLLVASSVPATAGPTLPSQVAFFNHSYAVLDAETADAIEHSGYLKAFGVLETQTTVANGGETWRGRYLAGRQTYLEFFGPDDLKDSPIGSTGFALSPDTGGGLAVIRRRLIAGGMAHPDSAQRTKQMGNEQVPWFDLVASPRDVERLSVWAMEYLPSYFDDPRAAKEPADYPGDISRERYRSDEYANRLMRDVSGIEIAAPASDIAEARAMLVAAGFIIEQTPGRLIAHDADMTITLDEVPREAAGLRRITFVLNQSASASHVEQIGHSTLTAGPGNEAVWTFVHP